MKIFRSFEEWDIQDKIIATLGTFDGLHLGHQFILKDLNNIAKNQNGKSLLISLHPHPRIVLNQSQNLKLIQTLEEKIAFIQTLSIDYLFLLPFNREIAELSAEEFLTDILFGRLNIDTLLIGYDHRLGKNREGNFELIYEIGKKLKKNVFKLKEFFYQGQKISSTIIRNLILEGNIVKANELLGRPFVISGVVVEGDKRGRVLGFPTANIAIPDPYKILPANGVYSCKVLIDDQIYYGVANLGVRPTFNQPKHQIEVHILDFSHDIYQKNIILEFYEFIRSEKKFNHIEELKNQIQEDIKTARKFFNLTVV